MNGRVFSVILLPTSECNVACEYCFEHKEPHRLSSALLPLLTRRLLDHLENEGIEQCEIYWQWRGDADGSRVVFERRRSDGPCRGRAGPEVLSLSANQSHQLFACLGRRDPWHVQRYLGNLDGLSECAPQTVQRRGRGLHESMDQSASRGAKCWN